MMVNPLNSIIDCIESNQSFLFNSGAGSGKTYNLIKTIEYLTETKGKSLLKCNQRIMVITYTNAATEEIVKRIGQNQICDISTIHTRLWEIIRRFQSDLLKLHLDRINDTIKKLDEELKTNVHYNDMSLDNEIENNKEFIKLFFKYSDLPAAEFKQIFAKYTKDNQIKSVSEFKSYVIKTRRYLKLVEAKSGIENNTKGYKKVEYDPFDNTDRLYKMKFSHDTLIEYSNKLVLTNRTVQKIISDKYPYVLIDEYQDTSPKVVELLGKLIPSMVVGFYGDSCQNIYGDGVGDGISELIPGLKLINNEINRRSSSSIVELGNRVRNDDLIQKPFLQEKGTVQVYYSKDYNDSVIDSFVKTIVSEFNGQRVDFFLLKNEQVAVRNGFGSFYKTIIGTSYYKNNYVQTTSEILSDDLTKLGIIPLHLYYVMRFLSFVNNESTGIANYIPKAIYGNMNMATLKKFVSKIKEMVIADTLGGLIEKIIKFGNADNIIINIVKENIKHFEFDNFDTYKSFLFDTLYGDVAESKIDEARAVIRCILETPIEELKNWYFYITNNDSKTINFHTFHGTKGLEFENVGVIITNDFNRKKDYFRSFFLSRNKEAEEGLAEKRNLLYVALTRAKMNLRVLYLDENFESVESCFRDIFLEYSEFSER